MSPAYLSTRHPYYPLIGVINTPPPPPAAIQLLCYLKPYVHYVLCLGRIYLCRDLRHVRSQKTTWKDGITGVAHRKSSTLINIQIQSPKTSFDWKSRHRVPSSLLEFRNYLVNETLNELGKLCHPQYTHLLLLNKGSTRSLYIYIVNWKRHREREKVNNRRREGTTVDLLFLHPAAQMIKVSRINRWLYIYLQLYRYNYMASERAIIAE